MNIQSDLETQGEEELNAYFGGPGYPEDIDIEAEKEAYDLAENERHAQADYLAERGDR